MKTVSGMIAVYYLSPYLKSFSHKIIDVGQLVGLLNFIMLSVFNLIIEIAFISNGKMFCKILSKCEEIAGREEATRTVSTLDRVMTLIFYCSFPVSVSQHAYGLSTNPMNSITYNILYIVWFILFTLSWMLIPILFREVLGITSRDLTVSIILDESVRGNVVRLDPRLDALERKIHKVSNLYITKHHISLSSFHPILPH